MAKSAEAAKKAVQKFYPNLLEVLPITEVVNCFRSRHLLSNHHKSELNDLPLLEKKIEYFLDKMLIPGLSLNYTVYFDGMIDTMRQSDDALARHLVGLINEELMPITVASPTSPTSSVTTDTGIVSGVLQLAV